MKNKNKSLFKNKASLPALVVATLLAFSVTLHNAWAEGPLPGTPPPQTQTPRSSGGGGFGFGITLDLGSIVRAVQALGDDKYTSPDTANLPQ